MSRERRFLLALVAGLALLLLLVGVLAGPAAPSEAAPPAAPTPITAPAGAGDSSWLYVNFLDADTFTADAGSSGFQLPGYDTLDLQYIIDQGTTNTTTLKIQYSMDNSTWSDGLNIVANNAADANAVVQLQNYARYTRIYADVTNTQTITITVKGIAKP